MKIAIVSGGMFDTTVPLVKAFLDAGHEVVFYAVCSKIEDFYKSSMFEFQGKFNQHFFQEIANGDVRGLGIVKGKNARVFLTCYNYFHTNNNIVVFLNSLLWTKLMKNFVRRFIADGIEYVIVIGHYVFLYELSVYLNNFNIPHTHSLHEVTDHAQSNSIFSFVKSLSEENVHLVVHSKFLKEQLLAQRFDVSNISTIPFGPSVGLRDFNHNEQRVLEIINGRRYFLSFGYISNYKGYDLLWKSYKVLSRESHIPFQIIVAGKGYDPYVEMMKQNEDFIVLNRFISNDEMATLIHHSIGLLCPYKSVSQSGLPQACMVYGKPVIATNIGSFREIIKNGVNGFLTEMNPESFAEAISSLYQNRHRFVNCPVPDEYEWENIVKKYECLACSLKTNVSKVTRHSFFYIHLKNMLDKIIYGNRIGGK